jgi:hypothetical protein
MAVWFAACGENGFRERDAHVFDRRYACYVKDRACPRGAWEYIQEIMEVVARQYGHRTSPATFSFDENSQKFVDALHDEFENQLTTRGLLDESVGATLSKWPSFLCAYAGAHHAMEEAHRYVQHRRHGVNVYENETLPQRIDEGGASEGNHGSQAVDLQDLAPFIIYFQHGGELPAEHAKLKQ